MNKNDIRYLKTEESLEKAFYSLKKLKKELTVTSLCKEIKINKTTFYDHYKNINQLQNEIYTKAIDKVIIDDINIDKALINLNIFVESLLDSLNKNYDMLSIIFDDYYLAADILENKILAIYKSELENIDLRNKLIFIVGGTLRLFSKYNKKITKEDIFKIIAK